jgi:GntR family transcriptional regulator
MTAMNAAVRKLPEARIDRTSPVPYYFQLKKILAEEIASGRWPRDRQLPSEPSICEHFQVSRTTVRQALGEMEAEGMIRREKGRGTFVEDVRSASWLLQSSHGFYEEAVRMGKRVTSRVLRLEVETLPLWASDALDLPEGSEGVTLERLRWVNDRMAMYVVNHLPEDLAGVVAGADLTSGSLYGVLEQERGLRVHGGRRLVEAVIAQDDLAQLLEVAPGAPLLFVESVSWDVGSRPFECYRAWHRADRTKIDVQVVRQDVASRVGLVPPTAKVGRR